MFMLLNLRVIKVVNLYLLVVYVYSHTKMIMIKFNKNRFRIGGKIWQNTNLLKQ